MKKILASGLKGTKGIEFEKGYKTALNVVYGMMAQGMEKEQFMDGLEDFFSVGERLQNGRTLYS